MSLRKFSDHSCDRHRHVPSCRDNPGPDALHEACADSPGMEFRGRTVSDQPDILRMCCPASSRHSSLWLRRGDSLPSRAGIGKSLRYGTFLKAYCFLTSRGFLSFSSLHSFDSSNGRWASIPVCITRYCVKSSRISLHRGQFLRVSIFSCTDPGALIK